MEQVETGLGFLNGYVQQALSMGARTYAAPSDAGRPK